MDDDEFDFEAMRMALQLEVERTQDEEYWTFDAARDSDSYVEHVIDRVQNASVIRTAAEDVADAFGRLDYHETVPALQAVKKQWHRAADSLAVSDRDAVRIRAVAYQLDEVMQREDFNPEHVTDVIAICETVGEPLKSSIGMGCGSRGWAWRCMVA